MKTETKAALFEMRCQVKALKKNLSENEIAEVSGAYRSYIDALAKELNAVSLSTQSEDAPFEQFQDLAKIVIGTCEQISKKFKFSVHQDQALAEAIILRFSQSMDFGMAQELEDIVSSGSKEGEET